MNRPPILPQGLPPDVAQEALNKLHSNNPPNLAGLQILAELARAQQHVKDQSEAKKAKSVQRLVFLVVIVLLLTLAPLLLFFPVLKIMLRILFP
ncbi:hypothetical protein [Nitrosospira multiformis]|uniref:hypothetical protein n=1 Tax=Nitrosospira multiformis TaxID=1231 RepID=UPI0008976181|nr:hypothetical protein [Nitrosospira multiformis]SEA62769.1 hypothetical protein SAMN05216411_11538 [Nitrosospira multiformis]